MIDEKDMAKEDFDKALSDLTEKLIATPLGAELGLDEKQLEASVSMAERALERGDAERAVRTYAVLILLQTDCVAYQLGTARAAMAAHLAEVALMAASAVIALRPTDPNGFYWSGMACMHMGEFALAIEDFTQCIDL